MPNLVTIYTFAIHRLRKALVFLKDIKLEGSLKQGAKPTKN